VGGAHIVEQARMKSLAVALVEAFAPGGVGERGF